MQINPTFLTTLPLALGGVGVVSQYLLTRREQRRFPPIGQQFTIDGRLWHLPCRGEPTSPQQPTIVVDGGLGSFSPDWQLVQREVAKFARICVIDRAGYGWSDPSPEPRVSQQMVSEHHALFTAAGLLDESQPPLILVGHSLGGLNMQIFASRYPERVAGVVLVDSAHETMYDRLAPLFQQLLDNIWLLQPPAALTARLGLVRLGINLALLRPPQVPQEVLDRFPADLQPLLYVPRGWPNYADTVMRELKGFPMSTRQLGLVKADKRQLLGDKPLIVVTANVQRSGERFRSVAPVFSLERFKEAWTAMQTDLLTLSSDSEQCIAEQSGHSIMVEQPPIVVEAIRRMVMRVTASN